MPFADICSVITRFCEIVGYSFGVGRQSDIVSVTAVLSCINAALQTCAHRSADGLTREGIFKKRLSGATVTREEELKFKTAFMVAMGRAYHKKGWAMLQKRAFECDNSWNRSAGDYIKLYKNIIGK